MMGSKRKYYAVAAGYEPGIYQTWAECERQVKGFKGQNYKSFLSKAEAEQYLEAEKLKRHCTVRSGGLQIISTKNAAASTVPKDKPMASFVRNPFRNAVSSSVLEMAPADYAELRVEPFKKELNLDDKTQSTPTQFPTHFNADLGSVSDVDVLYQLEYDGASKGNPGHAGAGALLRHPDGTVVCEISLGLGKTTNNVAEYRGLIAGLRKALDIGIQRIQAQGDSKLVTMQVRGKWKIKNENIAVLCEEAIQLLKNFREFQIRHVDREYNSAADVLANKGVGLPEEKFVSSFTLLK